MMAAVGGALSLFTGISVITIMEILYWVTRSAASLIYKVNIPEKNEDAEDGDSNSIANASVIQVRVSPAPQPGGYQFQN